MNILNPRYRNQGIHVEIVTFTVEDGMVKVLLTKGKTETSDNEWILPGGAVYNNESIDLAAARELREKTGIFGILLEQFYIFGDPNRDTRMRMVSVAYLALIDKVKVELLKENTNSLGAQWFDIRKVPKLAFDHNDILIKAIIELRKLITKTNLIKILLPAEFTLAELQRIYEVIIGEEFDRRNFRRKFLNMGLIEATGDQKTAIGHRPANFYRFIDEEYKEIEIF